MWISSSVLLFSPLVPQEDSAGSYTYSIFPCHEQTHRKMVLPHYSALCILFANSLNNTAPSTSPTECYRTISLQCQTIVPCFHPLTHQRTFTLIPWQPNLLRILWGGNLPKILENHGIWEWPDHPYLHAYRLLRNEYFLGTASLCKAVPILCYFVIFISLPSNSIL